LTLSTFAVVAAAVELPQAARVETTAGSATGVRHGDLGLMVD
jgi:hypothetical protein